MPSEVLDIEGRAFELKGNELRNTEAQLPPEVRFPRKPIWEQTNPDAPKGKRITLQADIVVQAPYAEKIVTLAARAYTQFQETFRGWDWVRQAVYESPTVINVKGWFDHRFYRIEWTVILPPEELGFAVAAAIPLLAVVAKVLLAAAALGGVVFLIVTAIRVKSPTLALGLVAVIVVGGLLLFAKAKE